MTPRDRFKPKAYFDKWIAYHTGTVAEFRAIVDNPESDPRHAQLLRHTILRRELELLIMRYSRGDVIDKVRGAYPPVIDALTQYQRRDSSAARDFDRFDTYLHALWIVSLGILLDAERSQLDLAIQGLNNQGRDAIFDRLLACCKPASSPAAAVLFPNPYALLVQALDAPAQARPALIEQFLAVYYDGMSGAYWYNTHEADDTGYFGYWCFELAAFVKLLGIDDTAFADRVYYPRDLVRASAEKE